MVKGNQYNCKGGLYKYNTIQRIQLFSVVYRLQVIYKFMWINVGGNMSEQHLQDKTNLCVIYIMHIQV